MRDVMARMKQGGGKVIHTMYRHLPDGTSVSITTEEKRRVSGVRRHEGPKGEVHSDCLCPECCAAMGRAYTPRPQPTAAKALVRASDRAAKGKAPTEQTRTQTVLRRRAEG